jgi:hypothetical protein
MENQEIIESLEKPEFLIDEVKEFSGKKNEFGEDTYRPVLKTYENKTHTLAVAFFYKNAKNSQKSGEFSKPPQKTLKNK